MSRDALDALIDDLIALQSHLHGAVVRQNGAAALESHWDARELLARLEPRLTAGAEGFQVSVTATGQETLLREEVWQALSPDAEVGQIGPRGVHGYYTALLAAHLGGRLVDVVSRQPARQGRGERG